MGSRLSASRRSSRKVFHAEGATSAGGARPGWTATISSIFFVNVPIAVVALAGTLAFVPESKDSTIHHIDPLGLLLSTAGVFTLVYTIIEASGWGWGSGKSVVGFAIAAVLLAAFALWELHTDEPMLPVRIFRNLRFTAASVSITAAFFALVTLPPSRPRATAWRFLETS